MSDVNLRKLERTWRASGSVADEAAWLRERLRVGDLGQQQLELAAYLAHAPACLALGVKCARWAPSTSGLATIELLDGLRAFGPEVLERASKAMLSCYTTVDRLRLRASSSVMPKVIPFQASREHRFRVWLSAKISGLVPRTAREVIAIQEDLIPWALEHQASPDPLDRFVQHHPQR